MKSTLGFVLLFLLILTNAFSAEKVYTSKSIFKHFKKAVVHIAIYQQKVEVSTGTGFFINNKGDLATNVHVMDNVLNVAGATAKFRTSDGKLITSYKIGKCGDERRIDLCVLRLKYKPTVWIPLDKSKPEVGTTVYAIGHPRGYNFSISKGIISGYREIGAALRVYDKKTNRTINQVQVSTPVSPGNSGGPIISENGKLVGVIQWGRSDKGSQNLNFGITKQELVEHYKKIISFKTPNERMDIERKEVSLQVDKYKKKFIKPIWNYLIKSEKDKRYLPNTPKFFNALSFTGFDNQYTLDLFNGNSKKCKVVTSNKTMKKYHCELNSTAGYYISIEKSSKPFDVIKVYNNYTEKTVPLLLLKSIKKAADWKKVKKTLTKKNIQYLSQFMSKPYKCRSLNKSIIGKVKHIKYCSASIYNYARLNGTASRYHYQFKGQRELLTVTSYSDQARYAGISIDAVALASLTLRFEPLRKKVASRSIASTAPKSLTVAQLMKQESAKKVPSNNIDIDSLRYKCSIKGDVKYCGDLYSALKRTSKNKHFSKSQIIELDSVAKKICESKRGNGSYCYVYGRSTKQLPYLIKSCKMGFKKACSARIPATR